MNFVKRNPYISRTEGQKIHIMGSVQGQYVNGDIPREFYTPITGPGWAHYSSNVEGKCEGCKVPTNLWHVTTKSKGKHWCLECRAKHIEKNRQRLEEYSRGYGTI